MRWPPEPLEHPRYSAQCLAAPVSLLRASSLPGERQSKHRSRRGLLSGRRKKIDDTSPADRVAPLTAHGSLWRWKRLPFYYRVTRPQLSLLSPMKTGVNTGALTPPVGTHEVTLSIADIPRTDSRAAGLATTRAQGGGVLGPASERSSSRFDVR